MSKLTQVVWKEGLFLKPQHFQHQQAFQLDYCNQQFQQTAYPMWGWRKLAWEQQAQRIMINHALGCCCDGTPIFITPEAPLEIEIPDGVKEGVLHIGLSKGETLPLSKKRHACIDQWAETPHVERIEVAAFDWTLTLDETLLHPMRRLPILRIEQSQGAGQVLIDEAFMPPLVHWREHDGLVAQLLHIEKQLPAHYQKLKQAAKQGEMLAIQQFQAQWQLFAQQALGHPYQAFILWLQLYSALLPLDEKQLCLDWPRYQHAHALPGWDNLCKGLKTCLSQAMDPHCWALSISQQGDQDMQLHFPKSALWQSHQILLAVASQVPKEQVQQMFGSQVTIGATQEIPQLINLQLPGINITPVARLPDGVPRYREYSYFQLDMKSPHWQKLLDDVLAVHVSQTFANTTFFAWAVKE